MTKRRIAALAADADANQPPATAQWLPTTGTAERLQTIPDQHFSELTMAGSAMAGSSILQSPRTMCRTYSNVGAAAMRRNYGKCSNMPVGAAGDGVRAEVAPAETKSFFFVSCGLRHVIQRRKKVM